jgi:hypothetical protein
VLTVLIQSLAAAMPSIERKALAVFLARSGLRRFMQRAVKLRPFTRLPARSYGATRPVLSWATGNSRAMQPEWRFTPFSDIRGTQDRFRLRGDKQSLTSISRDSLGFSFD